ncbi:MAG: CHASE3 domain-containing protein [Ferruginibacter sp.]
MLLATIIFIIVISYFQSRRVNDTAKLVEHSQEVLLHSQKLSSAILDNETESRGYVITGQQIFLAPLQKSQIAINQELSTLKSLTKQHAAVQARLDSLSYYSNKRVQFSNSLIAVRDKNAQAAMAMVETGEGKLYTDRIHFLIQNIQDIENDLLTERRQINEKKIATFNGILATVIIAVLILIGIFIQKTRKDFFEKRKATEELKKLNSELEQRVAERTDELLQSKNALAETFERIDDGFIALDKNWNYTYINKWAGKITYRTPESLLGKMFGKNFLPGPVGSATYNLFQK